MKKTWLIIAALCLLPCAAFAQFFDEDEGDPVNILRGKLRLEGAVKGGLRVDTTTKKETGTENDYETYFYGYSDDVDDGATALRVDITARYLFQNAGLKLNVREDIQTAKPNPLRALALSNAYGWFEFFHHWVCVYGGLIDDGLWGTGALGDTGTDIDFDKGLGVKFEFMPQIVQGLSFGVFFDLGGAFYSGTNIDIPARDFATPPGGVYTAQQFLSEPAFGALYSGTSWAVNASVKLHRSINIDNTGIVPGGTFKTYLSGVDILFGVKAAPVPGLLLEADARFGNIGFDKYLISRLNSSGEHLVDPLIEAYTKVEYNYSERLMLGGRFHFLNHVAYNTLAASAKPEDDIDDNTINDFDIRLYVMYDVLPAAVAGCEVQTDFVGLAKIQENDFSIWKGVSVKPSITFTITDGIKIVLYDKISINGENYGGAEPNKNFKKNSPDRPLYIDNRVQFDFIWTF